MAPRALAGLIVILAVTSNCWSQEPVVSRLPIVQTAAQFLERHCLSCHGPDEAHGGLRIDLLDRDLTRPATFARWKHAIQRLESGSMPPPEVPRPNAAELKAVLNPLRQHMDEIARTRRAAGRVVLRRLNRVEFQNTVRDLFDVNVDVKDVLPEDATSQGFDNVGAALTVSPVLMERYLEAADVLVTAALRPVHSLDSSTARYDLYDSLPKWFLAGVWKRDPGVILFQSSGNSATDLRKFQAPAPGRYRFRIRAAAHNSETPLPMAVLVGNFVVSGNPTRLVGYYDVPPDEPADILIETHLAAKNDTIKVTPVSLPFVYLKQETMADYPGPGLHIHHVEVEGPLHEEWPTRSYRKLVGGRELKDATLSEAERVVKDLLPRAFRRPVPDGAERPYTGLIAAALQSGQSYEAALRIGIKAILASPGFLYLQEPAGPLDDFSLASRLSYFLWSTLPDEELWKLAEAGTLHEPDVLRAQVERMLVDDRSRAFTENFTGQWLGLRDIAATTPDKTLYPEFDEFLQWSAVEETRRYFDLMLQENLGVRYLIDSDFALLNGRLATHYGIDAVSGVALRKVPLTPDMHRGGILTQASILKVTANGTTTSPVLRGVWILDRILGQPVPPPPPNVPAVEPDIRGATTIRDQLARHRATVNCAGCHSRIDPPGFALENYDVIGGWRDRYRVVTDSKNWVRNRVGPLARYLAASRYGLGLPVESGDTLPDGRSFADINDFKRLLLANPEQLARNLTGKLVTYATGAAIEYNDDLVIERIVAETRTADYGLRSLVHAVVASELFRNK